MKRMLFLFAALVILVVVLVAGEVVVVWGPDWVHPAWDDITQIGPPVLRQFGTEPFCAEIVQDPDTLDQWMVDLPDSACPVTPPARPAKRAKAKK